MARSQRLQNTSKPVAGISQKPRIPFVEILHLLDELLVIHSSRSNDDDPWCYVISLEIQKDMLNFIT